MTAPAASSVKPGTNLVAPGQPGLKAHSDGPPTGPVQSRSERFRSSVVDDFPAITGREAEWKYSPVAEFRDLVDPGLDGSRLPIGFQDTPGIEVSYLPREDARLGSAGTPEDRASAAAWSSFAEALLIRVVGAGPHRIELTRESLGTHPRAAHTVIEAMPGTRATVVLRGSGAARLSENVEILVRSGAELSVVSLQEWSAESVHLASHFASVEKDAKLRHFVVSMGGAVVRVNPSTRLAGEGSATDALGLYFADAGQHLENQVFVHHLAPHTRSRVTYKGALQGKGAHTVWVGDVLIGNLAVGTDSYEQNRNLVLTEGARADSVPNLEIETGDIVGAGHASATGRFDDEQLFYLESRGIPEQEARRLVVKGFLVEVLQQFGDAELSEYLLQALEAELSASTSGSAADPADAHSDSPQATGDAK